MIAIHPWVKKTRRQSLQRGEPPQRAGSWIASLQMVYLSHSFFKLVLHNSSWYRFLMKMCFILDC